MIHHTPSLSPLQHALLLPVLLCHLRFHNSLSQLERTMDYTFHNKYLLQLALTHPSFRYLRYVVAV